VIEDLWDRGDEWAEHRCLVAGAGVIQLADIVSRIDYGATIVGVVEDAGSVEALKGYAARVVQGTLAGYARSAGPERFSLIVLAPPVAEVAEQMEAAYPLLAAGGRILCFLPEALVDADPRDVLPSWPGIRGESFPNGGGCGHHPGITRVWYVDAPSRER
jgi:hypothetical protein